MRPFRCVQMVRESATVKELLLLLVRPLLSSLWQSLFERATALLSRRRKMQLLGPDGRPLKPDELSLTKRDEKSTE